MSNTQESSDVSKTGRGTVFMLAARIVFLGAGFIVSIILARGLGPADFGVYGVVMSLLLWIEMVLAAGIPNATTKAIHDYPDDLRNIEISAQILVVSWGLLLFTVCWFLAPSLALWLNIDSGAMLFRLAVLDVPLMAIYLAYQGILNGRRMFGLLSAGLIIHTTTKLVGILVLLGIGLSVAGALVAHIVATVIVLIVMFWRYPLKATRPSFEIIRQVLAFALPMGGYLIALQVLLGVGLWLLKALDSGAAESAGHYVAALNVTRIFLVIPSVMSVVLFSSLAWALARSDSRKVRDFIEGATRFGLVLLVPGCTLVFIDADAIMVLLFSELYGEGGKILKYQTVAFGAVAFFDIIAHALMAAGALWKSAVIVVGLIPVVIGLSWYLIGEMSGVGAAMALAIAMCTAVAIGSVLTARQFGTLVKLSTAIRVTVATSIVGYASTEITVTGLLLVVKLGALLATYLLILALLGEITRRDLKPFAVWAKWPRLA